MINNKILENYLNKLLVTDKYSDYAPNGLQVEGKAAVQRVVFGVTASLALIKKAISVQADAIIVHHGYFWKGESPTLTGMKQRRIQALLANEINLYAYHLPLDGHDILGNNAQLAQPLGIAHAAAIAPFDLMWCGELSNVSAEDFAKTITQALDREPLLIHGGSHKINKIAWCSGGAQGFLEQAVALGADAYLSGEISEKTYHEAKEYGIHYFAAGHHATERGGVRALSQYLQQELDLNCQFIDCFNPV